MGITKKCYDTSWITYDPNIRCWPIESVEMSLRFNKINFIFIFNNSRVRKLKFKLDYNASQLNHAITLQTFANLGNELNFFHLRHFTIRTSHL